MLFSEISKKQAFLTHLGVSVVIFIVLAYLIIFQWYPSYYMEIDGGDRGLATIFFVDVVLGPGLTLLVFKQGKKWLKFDMSMILLFQIIALSWGIRSVYLSRPGLTVFYDGRFACVAHDDIKHDVLTRLSNGKASEPVLAFLRRPDTYEAYKDFQKNAYGAESAEIYFYMDLYENINDDSLKRIASYQLDVVREINNEDLKSQNKSISHDLKIWSEYINDNPVDENIKYFPITCRYKQGMAAFDLNQEKIINFVGVYTRRAVSDIKLKLSEERIRELKAGDPGK